VIKVKKSKNNILYIAELGILTAIILLMSFTPLGYLHIGAIEITFISIPVAVGAIVMGAAAGALLGGVFGITSFIQCFGMSTFGTFLFSINPVFTAILCILPRVLMGLFTGLIFKAFTNKKVISFFIPSLSASLLNTVLFMAGLILMFWSNETFIQQMTDSGLSTNSIGAFFIAFVGINGLVEAIACSVIGTAVSKAIYTLNRKKIA
jgi:uncharacterized membrane protein